MIEIDPADRLPQSHAPRFPIYAVLIGIGALVCIAFFYQWYAAQKPHYAETYRLLGISSLPSAIEALPRVQTRLDQLGREPCYRAAMYDLADALLEAGYPRETENGLQSFAKRCGSSVEISYRRYKALYQASDFSAALLVADELVKSDLADAHFRYWRGNVYEELKDFSHALTDYINSVQLLGEPNTVAVDNFYDISRMYAALGRFCDAITPIETFIAFNPIENRTTQLTRLIAEYAEKGNCEAHYASGTARVVRMSFPGTASVATLAAEVNGVTGNFILDTGATYVAVTSEFATRARLKAESGARLAMKTVGGSTTADLAYASTVSVGKAQAQDVVVAVISDPPNPFGRGFDGLLGMSFLARFKVNVSQNTVEFVALPLR